MIPFPHRDGITADAIQKLHEWDYDTRKALNALLNVPFPEHEVFKRWPEDDVRNFIKGKMLELNCMQDDCGCLTVGLGRTPFHDTSTMTI